MKKNDPTTYPKWLLRKIQSLEDEKRACCVKGEKLKSRLDSLKGMQEILTDASWTKSVKDIPGGIEIVLTIRWGT